MAHARIDDDELITAINVTPLVDVVLVLLVVMMVTATYVASRSIAIDPPTVRHASSSPPTPLEIAIDGTGRVFLEASPITLDALRVRAIRYVSDHAGVRAVVSADRATAHGDVVGVLDVLRDASVERVSIRVRELSH